MEPKGPLRVLVVDDNEAVRMILTDMLLDLGHQVVGEAEDAEAALVAYGKLRPDLVTLDLSLSAVGGADGLSVLRALRKSDPTARVIVISGNYQKKIVEQVEKDGGAAVVPKPIKQEALIEAISWATRL
jgi:two-component system chemotaxis response regulator CheY